jgi:DNA-binding response OmpR family regulator
VGGETHLGYAPRILVVDDELGIQILFEDVLSSVWYYVTIVGRSRQALAQVRSREFDVAVVDLSLPDEDGLELIRQMRSASEGLKILATSGFMVGEMPYVALAAGASATLLKPTSPEALLHTVYRLIEPSGTWAGR